MWTPELEDRLRALWSAGLLSGAQIAKELGTTRNAILGKVHRLQLETRVNFSRGGRPKREGFERKKPKPRPVVIKPPPPAVFDAGIHPGQKKRFLELGVYSCRWPVGDTQSGFWTGDLFFCGDVRVEGKPYCAAHCDRAYHTGGPRSTRGETELRYRSFLRQAKAA